MDPREAENLMFLAGLLPTVLDAAVRAPDLTAEEKDRIAAVSFAVGSDHYQRLGFTAVPRIVEPSSAEVEAHAAELFAETPKDPP